MYRLLGRDKACLVSTLSIPVNYLELVDWTGRLVRSDKRGFIGQDKPAILHLLGIDGEAFVLHASPAYYPQIFL